MAKRGRPRDDSIQDFILDEMAEQKGVYRVSFKIADKTYCVIVRYKARPPKYAAALTQSPYQTFHELAETLRAKGARSASAKTLAHRLTTKFREARKGFVTKP